MFECLVFQAHDASALLINVCSSLSYVFSSVFSAFFSFTLFIGLGTLEAVLYLLLIPKCFSLFMCFVHLVGFLFLFVHLFTFGAFSLNVLKR